MPTARESVIEVLRDEGPITSKGLLQRLGVSRRRLYDIMQELVQTGQVARKPSLRDARQFYFVLKQ